jgi:RNA polymerase sigma-70 factor (ECF subfamily)
MPPETNLWYEENVQPHVAMLRAWLLSQYPNERDIDDVVQEAIMRVLRARAVGKVRAPKAFLFAIARNLVVGSVRKSIRQGQFSLADLDELQLAEDSELVSSTVARAEELEFMAEAIQSLPTRCRQVITLRKIYGMSQEQIAKELGISISTVESQVVIGMRKLEAFFAGLEASARRPA